MRRAPERNRLFDKAAENSLGKIGLEKNIDQTLWDDVENTKPEEKGPEYST